MSTAPATISFPLEVEKTLILRVKISNQQELDYINNEIALSADMMDVVSDSLMLEVVSINNETEETLRVKLQAQEPAF